MINLSQKNIVKVSQETGFIKDNVEKVMRLADILEFIFSSPWKDKLVLKGDTAINLFYMNLPRLSVDIDLDYLGETKEEMLADKAALGDFLRAALFQKNYSLSVASKSYFALESYVFQYLNNAGNRDNIKIEVNFLDRAHVLPLRKLALNTSVATSDAEINVLDAYELYGSKLATLVGRCKPRDVYDVYGMINKNLLPDISLLKKCLIFYNCIGGEANITEIHYAIFDELTHSDFSRMLKPMLTKQDRFDEKRAIVAIKEYLKSLLDLSAEEMAFVSNFRTKVYSPELLFNDNSILSRIEAHPMALWRCKE